MEKYFISFLCDPFKTIINKKEENTINKKEENTMVEILLL